VDDPPDSGLKYMTIIASLVVFAQNSFAVLHSPVIMSRIPLLSTDPTSGFDIR
jgi:hypothetical protein